MLVGSGTNLSISVVIPVYNGERHIGRAVQSVLDQTLAAGEIIVVDDGSADKTADIVRAFGERVRLIQQPNSGASVARNTGVGAAKGDWIAFLDADDEWLPDKLQLQAQQLQSQPDLVWSFTNLLWDRFRKNDFVPSQQARQDTVFDDYFAAYPLGCFVSTITVMIRRCVFDVVGLFEPGMKRAQDNDLWFRIAYRFPRVGYIAKPLSIYHLDTPGSSTKVNDQVEFMVHLIRRHETLSHQYDRYEAFRPCITHMLQDWIRALLSSGRRRDAKVLLTEFESYLPARFRREMCFRMNVPIVGPALSDAVHLFKGLKNR